MSNSLINRVEGQIVTPDGTPINRPATIFGADAAAILRNYFHWALSGQLEPELFCVQCYDGTKESKAIYQIDADEIVIQCQCQIRYFKGGWLKPLPMVKGITTVAAEGGPAHIALSSDEASLLRFYKKVLIDYGLAEALRCNACNELSYGKDGCHAQVTDNAIKIQCRCSTRTFQGMTT